MKRRTVIVASAGLCALAGCTGTEDGGTDTGGTDGQDATTTDGDDTTPDGDDGQDATASGGSDDQGTATATDGNDDDEEKTEVEIVDAKGDIEIVIDGSPVDLSADRFQAEHAEDDAYQFHLHEGDDYWYMEGPERVTFGEAIDYLPHFEYARENGDDVVTFDGTVYDAGESETVVTFVVNGDEVDPTEYELWDGDELLLEISTGE